MHIEDIGDCYFEPALQAYIRKEKIYILGEG